MTTSSQMQAAVDKAVTNFDRFDQFINGDVLTDVQTDNGVIPSLRKSLASSTIDGFPGLSGALATKISKTDQPALLDDYILSSDPRIGGIPDASLAFGRAAAVSTVITAKPGSTYYVKDVVLDGRKFDGRNCVLRDAPGASFGIKLQGYAPALESVFWQDQGNYVSSTTLNAAATTGANSISVVSATGFAIGDVIFIDIDANEVRWQTFVTSVSGTTIGIRDPLPGSAAAGKSVEAMQAAIVVGAATDWSVSDVLVINARGALLTMPPSGQVSNKGSVRRFSTDGYRYFGWIKAGDTAGVKASDVKLWGGFVETFNYTGNGTAGPYSFTKKVFLLRDVTVTVNGVAQVYGTDWNYASQTSIQFLAGRFPGTGAAIAIYHFRDGYRGFVEDQRNTAIISGGNLYDAVECLDAFVGASFFESDLTEVRSLISDTCQYGALQTNGCTNTLVFSGDTFLGYSGSSLKSFSSLTKIFQSLYTNRVPLADQWLSSLDDNIYVDAASEVRINAGGWSGEFQHNLATGGKCFFVGAHQFEGRNVANIAGGSTVYLAPYGHSANLGDTGFRAPRNGTLKSVRVDVDVAPGAAQSYTYDVLVSGISVGTITISGASVFASSGVLNTFVPEGTQINLRLVTSSTAAAGARHFMQVQMI